MSLVRSLKKEEIDPEPSLRWLGEHLGFLRDEHQMNVGLTRARRGLCIIGEKNRVVVYFLSTKAQERTSLSTVFSLVNAIKKKILQQSFFLDAKRTNLHTVQK